MKPEKIIDIENFETEINELVNLSSSIDSNFQAMVFDYINKISGKFSKNLIADTRSDVAFRIHSIMYFTKLLWYEEQSLLTFINQNTQIENFHRMMLPDKLVFDQKTIFDSILYHLASIYDYYANMLGLIYYNKGLKWNKLVISSADKNKSKIGQLQKALIINSHTEFVDSLFCHRSYLIHNSISTPGFKYTHDTVPNIYSIKIITPQKFINEFKSLKREVGNNQISLKASLVWVLKYGFTNLNKLLYGMKVELESLRKKEKGTALIDDIRYPDDDVSINYWRQN